MAIFDKTLGADNIFQIVFVYFGLGKRKYGGIDDVAWCGLAMWGWVRIATKVDVIECSWAQCLPRYPAKTRKYAGAITRALVCLHCKEFWFLNYSIVGMIFQVFFMLSSFFMIGLYNIVRTDMSIYFHHSVHREQSRLAHSVPTFCEWVLSQVDCYPKINRLPNDESEGVNLILLLGKQVFVGRVWMDGK